jgi:hypothetical protein
MALVRRRGTIQSEKSLRKRRKKVIFAVVLFVVAIGSVVTALSFFSRAGFLQIQSVEVTGSAPLSIVSPDAVQKEIDQALTGNWLYLFSKNSLFLYPKNAIRAKLLSDFPAIASIDFKSQGSFLGFGRHISIQATVTERAPFALACDSAGTKCFYTDSSGFVYAPAPDFSNGIYVRYGLLPSSVSLSAVTSSSTPIFMGIISGKPLVDPVTFAAVKKIVGAISGMGLNVIGDDIGADAFGAENQITIAIASSSLAKSNPAGAFASSTIMTVLYFNENEPVDTELRYFSEFWQNQATSTAPNFQYVDMRYGKDIVYKVYK